MAELNAIFPDCDEKRKREALVLCNGDTSLAASQLIEWTEDVIDDELDKELLTPIFSSGNAVSFTVILSNVH